MQPSPETILVVDDSPEPIAALIAALRRDYRVLIATDGPRALTLAQTKGPNLVLLDLEMPGMNGHEVCRRLKANPITQDIPVIFVTATRDAANELFGLKLGAVDYIHKPLNPTLVLSRVRNHMALHNQSLALEAQVRERTRELEESRIEIIRRLGRAAAYRDRQTGQHVIRVSQLVRLLALATGLPEDAAESLALAAPMHDLGTIGIPDHIIQKSTPLDPEELALMRRHVQIGAEIIGVHDSEPLKTARVLALTHHERWDGTGYPAGLAGADIPLAGRILAIADAYDGLTNQRPDRPALTPEAAFAYLETQAGRAYDPDLVRLFLSLREQILTLGVHQTDAIAQGETTPALPSVTGS